MYKKGANWLIFNPSPTTIWVLRKICKTRDKLSHWIQQIDYNICDVHKDLSTLNACVPWSKFVWNRFSILNAHFVLWLALLNKLKTKDELH